MDGKELEMCIDITGVLTLVFITGCFLLYMEYYDEDD